MFPQYCQSALTISTGGHIEDGMASLREEEVWKEKWGLLLISLRHYTLPIILYRFVF